MKQFALTRRVLLVLVLMIARTNSFCQAPQFLNGYNMPLYPSMTDSISIIDSAWVGDSGNTRTSYNLSFRSDSIIITNCYRDTTGLGIVKRIKDTTQIGTLVPGPYHCILYSKFHRSGVDINYDCSQLPYIDTFTFSFIVSQYPAAINEATITSLAISPNPAKSKLYLNTLLQDIDLTISDMTARVYVVPYSQREIDVSSLSAGVYCIRLQDRSGTIVRRFVKE